MKNKSDKGLPLGRKMGKSTISVTLLVLVVEV